MARAIIPERSSQRPLFWDSKSRRRLPLYLDVFFVTTKRSPREELIMRKLVITLAATLAIIFAGSLAWKAEATTLTGVSGLQP